MIAIILLGVENPKGGMFEYGKCWQDNLESNGFNTILVGCEKVISNHNKKTMVFNSEIGTVGYKKYLPFFLIHFFRNRKKAKDLCKELNRIGCQEVRIVDYFSFSSLWLRFFMVFLNSGIRLVTTIHDPIIHEGQFKGVFGKIISKSNYWILKTLNRKGLVLHFHDRKLVKNTQWEALGNVEFIPHPIPVPICVKQRKSKIIRFIFAGRIEPYKGLDVLVDAFVKLKKYFSYPYELLIVGRGNIEERVLNVIHGEVNIELINEFVSDQELHQYIVDSDVMVLPYKNATSSGVGALAVAYNVPVITTKVGTLTSLLDYHTNSVGCEASCVESLLIAMKKYLCRVR